MATDPRLRYDIEAQASGQEAVRQLGVELDRLDESLDPQAALRVAALRSELDALTKQDAAVRRFMTAVAESDAASKGLDQAQAAANKLATALQGVEQPTRSQAGQMQRLADEAKRAQERLHGSAAELNASRTAMEKLGIAGGSARQAHDSLGDAAERLSSDMQALRSSMSAFGGSTAEVGRALDSSFRVLGVRSVQAVQQEVKQLQVALAQIRASDVLPADKERAVAAFNARVQQLRGELGGTSAGMQQLGAASASAGSSLASAANKAVAWTAALVGISSATDVARRVIETGAAFETLQGRLTSLLGSTEAADAAFARIKDLAMTTPFEVAALTESFAKLTAFGLQPSDAQMRALADTAATLGGGTETLAGVTTALGQAWAKGKLQGEEILQLAERGVPIWDALATATGRSSVELQQMSHDGKLGRDVILKLIDALGHKNFGASATLMNTFNGAVSNAKDAMSEFFDLIARSGVLDYLTAQIQELLADFQRLKDSGELQAKAKAIADSFIAMAEGVKTAIEAVGKLSGLLPLLLSAFAAKKILDFTQALRGVGPAAQAAAAGATAAQAQLAAAGGAATGAASAVGAFGKVLSLLKWTGLGLLVNGVVELGSAFFRAKGEAARLDKAVEDSLRERPNHPKKAAEDAAAATQQAISPADAYARKLDDITRSGDEAAAKVKQLGDAAKLDSVQGLTAFATVMREAGAEGRLAADQMQVAWAGAIGKLTGEDLVKLRTQAEFTFQQGSIDAQAFAAVMDGTVRQAFKGAGLDFDQLASGIGAGAKKAIAELDIIIAAYDDLKAKGVDASTAIEEALSKAAGESKTAEVARELEQRLIEMGKSGKLAAHQVAEGIELIWNKADAAGKGVNSMEEALRTFGLKTRFELDATAEKFKQAWERIRNDTALTLKEKQQAFEQYAKAAIAANGGVIDSDLRLQATILKLNLEVDKTGEIIVKGMEKAATATDGATQSTKNYSKAIVDLVTNVGILAAAEEQRKRNAQAGPASLSGPPPAPEPAPSAPPPSSGSGPGSSAGGGYSIYGKQGYTINTPPPDDSGDWQWVPMLNKKIAGGEWQLTPEAEARRFAEQEARIKAAQPTRSSTRSGYSPFGTHQPPAPPPPAPTSQRTVTVDLRFNGSQGYPLQTDERTAEALLRALDDAKRSSGWGGG